MLMMQNAVNIFNFIFVIRFVHFDFFLRLKSVNVYTFTCILQIRSQDLRVLLRFDKIIHVKIKLLLKHLSTFILIRYYKLWPGVLMRCFYKDNRTLAFARNQTSDFVLYVSFIEVILCVKIWTPVICLKYIVFVRHKTPISQSIDQSVKIWTIVYVSLQYVQQFMSIMTPRSK